MATSSGVVVTNGAERRLTLAAHGFPDTDNVHHPELLPHWRIGTIRKWFPLMDVGLYELPNPLEYSNKQYFHGESPRMSGIDCLRP